MKLTNPETIQASEKEFIDTINAELDWDAIEQMLIEKHNFSLQDEVDYKNGDLVVYKDKIAYKFDFEVKVPLSVIFDRQGDCLKISTRPDDEPDENQDFLLDEPDEDLLILPEQNNKVARMASDLADMISEINQGDD